jgi:Xaa-Pro aminopeptidase
MAGERRISGRIFASMRTTRFAALLALAIFSPLSSTAGPLQDDLRARRAKAMERLGPDTLAIFWSAPTRVYSGDVDYEYRQESNLFYLTGVDQQDTILLLMPGNTTRREVLFIRQADARREHWEGHSLTAEEATAQSGIATVMTTDRFDAFVAAMFSKRPMGGEPGEYDKFFGALTDGRARLSMLLEPQSNLTDVPGPARQFGASLKERFFGFGVQDATPILWDLRQIKTPYEQAIMRKSLAISNEAHKAGMREAAPGKFEYEVEAAIEHVYLRSGAMSWGYPSIVGSGPNATILHYNKSSRRMERGDLLLVDAAGNYEGYTGDITRTYPVSGTFAPAQRDIYEIVLAAQEAGIATAKAGKRFSDIQAACDDVLRAGLLRLGLVTDAKGQQFKIWSTHGVSHWIGMEVHDVAVPRPLGPGMTFVIEPGIYIRDAALDNLPKTPENAAFIEKVRPMVQKYRNIGVRIEDSFLLTEAGLERLSTGVPRTIDEIERFMAGKK